MLKNNEFRGVARIIIIITYDLIFENIVYFLPQAPVHKIHSYELVLGGSNDPN